MSDETTDPAQGSRTARVLDPSFVDGLEDLSIEEVRGRRDQAYAEREFQSYLRRLIQVRQDLLLAEQRRRLAGEPPLEIVERVTEVLSGGPKGTSRGEVLRVALSDTDTEEADRRVRSLLGDLAEHIPLDLEDERLVDALQVLEAAERAASDERRAVLSVHDRLQDELKRRYRQDPTLALR